MHNQGSLHLSFSQRREERVEFGRFLKSVVECGEGDLSGNGSTVVISRYTFDFYIFISEIGDLLAICFSHIGNYLVDRPTQIILISDIHLST